MKEIRKDIPGYEGYYKISNTGKMKSIDRTIIRKNGCKLFLKGRDIKTCDKFGYAQVHLSKGGNKIMRRIHRLVMLTFIGNANGLHVDHIDCNKLNNNLENLEYVTRQENSNRANINGLYKNIGESRRKPIMQICGTTGKIIAIYKSIMECERRTLITNQQIIKTCKEQNILARGFTFRYMSEFYKIYKFRKDLKDGLYKKGLRARSVKIGKNIKQIDRDTLKVINTFYSIKEASRQTGGDSSSISKVCAGKLNHCKGYKWEIS